MSVQESTITPNLPKNSVPLAPPQAEEMSEDGRYVVEERYWAEYYQHATFTYEWNNGYLEQKPMSDYAQFLLYTWFLSLLRDFLYVNPIGRMVGLELGFRMALPHKTTVRIPDLAVVLDSNPIVLLDKDRSYGGIYDICLESISDSSQKQIDRDVIHKKNEYAAAGVQEYYILDERNQETQFYRLNAGGIYLPIPTPDGIVRSSVLPGFQFRLRDLYRRPEPPEMIEDVVYRGYVSPHLRAERERAEHVERQLEQERQARKQEYEELAALLQKHDIDLDELRLSMTKNDNTDQYSTDNHDNG